MNKRDLYSNLKTLACTAALFSASLGFAQFASPEDQHLSSNLKKPAGPAPGGMMTKTAKVSGSAAPTFHSFWIDYGALETNTFGQATSTMPSAGFREFTFDINYNYTTGNATDSFRTKYVVVAFDTLNDGTFAYDPAFINDSIVIDSLISEGGYSRIVSKPKGTPSYDTLYFKIINLTPGNTKTKYPSAKVLNTSYCALDTVGFGAINPGGAINTSGIPSWYYTRQFLTTPGYVWKNPATTRGPARIPRKQKRHLRASHRL